jgi:hypothetical protein
VHRVRALWDPNAGAAFCTAFVLGLKLHSFELPVLRYRAMVNLVSLIIAPTDYIRWLSGEPDPRDLMRPFPAEPMRMWPISTRVNKPTTPRSSRRSS